MIKATFYKNKEQVRCFIIQGHSGYAEEGSDIICASVSSAAYMAANTLTEVIGAKVRTMVDEGYIRLILEDAAEPRAQAVLQGLELHISTLAQDYDEYILCEEKTL